MLFHVKIVLCIFLPFPPFPFLLFLYCFRITLAMGDVFYTAKLFSGYCTNWQKSDQHPNDQLNDEMSIQKGSHPNLQYMLLNIHLRSSKFKGCDHRICEQLWGCRLMLFYLPKSLVTCTFIFSTLCLISTVKECRTLLCLRLSPLEVLSGIKLLTYFLWHTLYHKIYPQNISLHCCMQ